MPEQCQQLFSSLPVAGGTVSTVNAHPGYNRLNNNAAELSPWAHFKFMVTQRDHGQTRELDRPEHRLDKPRRLHHSSRPG